MGNTENTEKGDEDYTAGARPGCAQQHRRDILVRPSSSLRLISPDHKGVKPGLDNRPILIDNLHRKLYDASIGFRLAGSFFHYFHFYLNRIPEKERGFKFPGIDSQKGNRGTFQEPRSEQ